MKSLNQLLLDFDYEQNFKDDDFYVGKSNFYAFEMINKWPNSYWKLDSNSNPHEADFLQLDISKAESKLGWKPIWELNHTLEKIIDWHQAWLNKEDMQTKCLSEIKEYMADMSNEA